MAGKSGFTSYVSSSDPPLISFDGCDTEGQTHETLSHDPDGRPSADRVNPDNTVTGCGSDNFKGREPKLCGYLNKYKEGARGIGRNFKKRWFVYVDTSCKLLYYRTPSDILPLGEIDIANASFSFEVGNGMNSGRFGRSHVFEISSKDRHYYLEAADHQTLMYWLQRLQWNRSAFSQRKTSVSTEKCQLNTLQQPSAGLVGGTTMLGSDTDSPDLAPFLGEVQAPRETVGESSARVPGGKVWSNVSISNWKTELRNALANMRAKVHTDMDATLRSSLPSIQIEAPNSSENPMENQARSRGSRLGSLRKKIKSRSVSIDSDLSIPAPQTSPSCPRCKQNEFVISQQQEETLVAEEELEMTRELLRLLQKEIDLLHNQRLTQEKYDVNDPESQLAILLQKDKRLVDLEHLVSTISEEKEMLNAENKLLELKVASMQQDIEMFRDSLCSKDEVIVSLTNKIFDLEQGKLGSERQNSATNTTLGRIVISAEEVEQLKDSMAAFQLQNTFLNKEILELNKLRANDEKREKQIYLKCMEWEARYYQTHSKYLLTLEQLQTPQRGGAAQPEDMVKQLLDDALKSSDSYSSEEDLLTSQKLPYVIRSRAAERYDQYGFLVSPTSEVNLAKQADMLQKMSDNLLCKDVEKEIAMNVRWENFLISIGTREISRSSELKGYIREGVPCQYRSKIWNSCVDIRVGKLRERLGPDYYSKLLQQVQRSNSYNPATKQIELDLLRTLPNNRHYETLSSEGILKLRRVLQAHTQHNPDLGYCQGQNRLAAIALLFLNEEDAFWCMVAITECLMPPDYYSRTLMAAQADQRVLKDLVGEKMPRLLAHLEQHAVDLTLFTFNWFLTIFVDNIPTETYLKIWDAYLYEGNKVLFRFAMASLKYREEELVNVHESIALHREMRRIGEELTDVTRLAQIAFHEMNPLSMRHIQTKRHFYLQQVKHELAEMDKLRSDFRNTRSVPVHDIFDLASDDEL